MFSNNNFCLIPLSLGSVKIRLHWLPKWFWNGQNVPTSHENVESVNVFCSINFIYNNTKTHFKNIFFYIGQETTAKYSIVYYHPYKSTSQRIGKVSFIVISHDVTSTILSLIESNKKSKMY